MSLSDASDIGPHQPLLNDQFLLSGGSKGQTPSKDFIVEPMPPQNLVNSMLDHYAQEVRVAVLVDD